MTSACHLCEQAEAIVVSVTSGTTFCLRHYDIADDEFLVERYGSRIPVLALESGQELSWPFSATEVAAFLELI